MFKYRIYGLSVLSERALDCYPHAFETADIVVRFTSSEAQAKQYADDACGADDQKEMGTGDGLGSFYFCGDKTIVVYYQNEDYLERFLIHCLLGFGFSYLLRRRKIFFLHGCSVLLEGSATILVGPSGAGKSSLAASLVQQGGRILADDTTRVELDSDTPFAYPSYPLRRLYKNTLEHLDLSTTGGLEIFSKKDKFSFSDLDQSVFLNQDAPIKAIVKINPTDAGDVTLVREDVHNSILIICRNVFNYQLLNHSVYTGDYLDFALKVCEKLPVYTLNRPQEGLTVREQAAIILKEIYHKDSV